MARTYQSTLTRKGQATIPIELREEFGLQEGDKLIWSRDNGHITVTTAQELIKRTAGMFKDRIPPLPPGGIEQRIADEKEIAANSWTARWDQFKTANEE